MSRDLNDVVIGPYVDGDEHEILRVFTKVFGVERSLEAWRWQYLENPAGTHIHLAKFPDGAVVSQFCGVPRRMKVRDEEYCFSEIVDSYTDPDYRQGLKKPGLFASTCYEFVNHFGRPDREIIMYGLPNPPAYRVGSRLLGYVKFYKIELLTKHLEGDAADPGDDVGGGVTAHPVERFSDDVDQLYASVSTHHDVMTIRDARYLNWRYTDRPDATYDQIEFRDAAGAIVGLCSLRHRWLDQPETVPAELLVGRDHPAVPHILRWIEARSRARGADRIRAMFRPDSPEWTGLASLGYVPERSPFRLVARTYEREVVPLDWLRDNWYVTMGDFDIV